MIGNEEATCPRCHHRTAATSGHRNFWCHKCKMEFDPSDDGDVGYQRPERIAARREEFLIRQRQRKARS